MISIDPAVAREFLEGIVAAFAVLGGFMAYFSGFEASRAFAAGQAHELVAHRINEGLAFGFNLGTWAAIMALMIMGWT